MAKLKNDDLRKRKKEDLFVEGYYIPSASDVTSGIDAAQNSIDVYGEDDPLTETTVNNGTLNVTLYEKTGDITLQSLLTNQDPGATGNHQFYYNEVTSVGAWINVKDKDNTKYVRSMFFNNWVPTPGLPQGGAGEKSQRAYSGQCGIPKEFDQPIVSERVTLTGSPALQYGPWAVPGSSPAVYAIKILAIDDTSSWKTQEVKVSATMVLADKSVSKTAIEAALDAAIFSAATQAFILYLADNAVVTGVYPSFAPNAANGGKLRT